MFSVEEKQLLKETLGEISARIKKDEPLTHELSNKDLETLYSRAYSLYQSGDYAKSKVVFHQLTAAKPLKQTYWLGLGACFQLEKNYEQALQAWGMASILDGHDPTPHFHAAQCCFALDDTEQGWNALKASKALLTSHHQDLRAKIEQLENHLEGA